MEKKLCENLLKAMAEYAEEACWTDREFVDVLLGCGLTKKDFEDCGYGDYVKEYLKDENVSAAEPMRISESAYELYKMDWIAQHITREIELATYREYFKYRAYQLENGEEVDTYEEWLFDIGFPGGQLYACYEEFCDGEYHDRDFVAYLFGNEEEFLKEYLEDIKDDYLEEVD